MCLFGNLVEVLSYSNKHRKIVRSTCGSNKLAMRISEDVAKKFWKKIYLYKKLWKTGSIDLAYVVP